MPRLFLFNPSHEMALAANTVHYTPTKHVAQMEREQCLMPLQWADDDDVVLTPDGIINREGNKVPLKPDMVPTPWGWNKAVKHRFLRLGVDKHMMPTDAELDLWRTFASRRWAADYASHLYEALEDASFAVENNMQFCNTDDELDAWMTANAGHSFILKSEFSSSGRGNSINRIRHAPVLADRFYDKTIDFALEYEIKETEVRYLGLSVFRATREGRYVQNYTNSQSELEDMVLQHLPSKHRKHLSTLANIHKSMLGKYLLGRYRGYTGIDMLVTADGLIHPCIELNLRMTMGVAQILSNQNTY